MNKDRFNNKGCRVRQLRKKFIDVLAINEIKEPWIEYCENFEPTDKEKRIRLSLIADYLREKGESTDTVDEIVEALEADCEVDIIELCRDIDLKGFL